MYTEMAELAIILPAVASIGGLLAHWLYFIHGERHTDALAVVKTYLVLPPTSVLVLYQLVHLDLRRSVILVFTTLGCFNLSLCTSILIYRAFFHPLQRFPGPPLAKLSKLYHATRLKNFDNYRVLAAWHDRYGDVVRTGRRDISLSSG